MSSSSKNSEIEKQEKFSLKKIGYEDIKKFVRLVERSDIHELEIIQDGTTLRIKKDSQAEIVHQIPIQNNIPAVPGQAITASAETESPFAPSSAETPTPGNLVEVKSPMVGTFYRASAPDADTFVQTGQNVSAGKVLCIIEAMKLMNEIECEYSGKIAKVMAENARPVEFGQVLFLIEPE